MAYDIRPDSGASLPEGVEYTPTLVQDALDVDKTTAAAGRFLSIGAPRPTRYILRTLRESAGDNTDFEAQTFHRDAQPIVLRIDGVEKSFDIPAFDYVRQEGHSWQSLANELINLFANVLAAALYTPGINFGTGPRLQWTAEGDIIELNSAVGEVEVVSGGEPLLGLVGDLGGAVQHGDLGLHTYRTALTHSGEVNIFQVAGFSYSGRTPGNLFQIQVEKHQAFLSLRGQYQYAPPYTLTAPFTLTADQVTTLTWADGTTVDLSAALAGTYDTAGRTLNDLSYDIGNRIAGATGYAVSVDEVREADHTFVLASTGQGFSITGALADITSYGAAYSSPKLIVQAVSFAQLLDQHGVPHS